MTNEEMQRTMEFILEQQASFAAGMEQMRKQTEKRVGNLETAFVGLFNVVTDIGKAQLALTGGGTARNARPVFRRTRLRV
jgi:hypothetical protein